MARSGSAARSPSRVLAIWCMDWPAVAAAQSAELPATAPVAVTLANRVIACSAAARAVGVKRSLRRREAQARCPQLHVVTADPARDARYFEGVTAAVDALVPRAEVLRPGLLVLSVRGAARFFGSEEAVAERLIDAVAAGGAECQVGIADQLPTAVFAARAGRIVEPGGDAKFLSPLSIRMLATEPSLSSRGRAELADLLWRMGIRNLGQFAELSRSDVASRFGADAVLAHRLARAEPMRAPSGREPPADLAAVLSCDPPIDRVDAAAFAGRSLAGELHRSLESAGVGCTRLGIHAITSNGQELERVWRCAEPLTEDATADRIRWQLDGWLNRRNAGDRPSAPITQLRLEPVEVVSAGALQLPLWGGLGEEDRLRARRALVRVQGLLGPDSVQVPVLSGGRGPAERITLTPLGDELVPRADPTQPWPGRLPEPSPTVVLDEPVELLDEYGNPVRVTSRGLFSADPARLDSPAGPGVRAGSFRGDLQWWAGPWPVDERWWDPQAGSAGRTARVQVLLESDARAVESARALLLCYRRRHWYVEGVYE
ncbi:DNA polymerase Y family protein [Mycolicibacterium mengxianglii]|uniref:DNA polymerase Y family protein n=1 Tax=Mycolicibacterium mengxianglii TaxID=2736649 RepID=UPI0018EF21C4|nr:DNA polymerase Y family protein [Mycolicibacterium mengxianglii]